MTVRLLTAFLLLAFLPISSYAVSGSGSFSEAAKQVSNEPAIGAVQDAMQSFKALSKKEKKSKLKEVKQQIKLYKQRRAAGEDISANTLLLVILAILVPPLAVYLYEGEITTRFWISLLLTILGFILFGSFGAVFLGSLLGIIYSLIVILGG